MNLFSLRNLSSHEVTPCVPWEFPPENLAKVPPDCFSDKKARDAWANRPSTTHQMYSCYQGVNPNLRISKENPPFDGRAVPIDVDCKLTRPELDGALERMGDRKPNYIETTFSGQYRLVWLLEVPIAFLGDADYAKFILQRIHELLPYRQCPGVDEPAVESVTRYYTNGCRWEKIHDVPLAKDLVLGWLLNKVKEFNWGGVKDAVKIPLDIVAAKMAEKYPNFVTAWPGGPAEFKKDAQGPTFWEPESESPKSAIVNEEGIYSFSKSAQHKPFMLWSDFFGAQFVAEYQLKLMGNAVEGIFYDGKQFIRKQGTGHYIFGGADDLGRHLRCERGLSDRRPKGKNSSSVDDAITHIQNNGLIESAGSFSFYQKGIMPMHGKRFLNVHNRDVLQPASGTQKWGDNFPFLAKFYDGWLTSGEALEAYIAYLAYAYTSAFMRNPKPGQVTFFVGPPACGKTLNTRYIVGVLFSGYAECQDWIMGRDQFNSELFEVFIWAIDDNMMGLDPRSHRIFTEMLKRACANQAFRSNEKFRKAGLIDWSGRILGSLNDDPDSLRGLPETGMSNLDKLNLFRCVANRTDGFLFPDRDELNRILVRELPYFGRYLLDYEIPARRLGKEKRYGPVHYHDASLIQEANQSSSAAAIGEQVDEWMRLYFVERHPEKTCWEGTAYQLYMSMAIDCHMSEAMGRTTAESLGKMLPVLAQKGFDIKIRGDEHRRTFTICRGNRYPQGPIAKAISQTPNNPYQK